MGCLANYNLVSLIVAIASLVVAGAATKIAKNSLSEVRRVAERDLRDWKQRTWAHVYLKADEAHDVLNAFQAQYAGAIPAPTSEGWADFVKKRNELIHLLRRVNSTAALFPGNEIMDELFAITSSGGFKENGALLSKKTLDKLLNATENIREKARIKESAILD